MLAPHQSIIYELFAREQFGETSYSRYMTNQSLKR
jgi:hypothetical protein